MAAERWQQPDYILDSLVEVGLRAEHGPDPLILRKWRQPLRVYIEHRVAERSLHEQLVDAHLTQLAQITGHSIQRVGSRADANVELLLLRQQDLLSAWQSRTEGERIPEGTLCLAKIWARGGEIRRALVAIPVDQASQHGKLVSCIVEELTQILGLPNDSEKVFPSVFNDRSTDQLLSGLDLVLLKLLYDARLQPGMGPEQVRQIGMRVIRELAADGVIADAARQVREGELYRMLGYGG
ncbi:hypothetical protein GCM10011352_25450 [Marinobacterium zhoushanense]|uniref:Uncharacterized protein n=1 Tax=Marinobacterium zhoushanense TaxID=1679163 RepID=A0ABQ1KGB2_9GAMM|nr:DUF2927 domain-containing protein [Marinobacterium zhoushanense]GGB98260.1 hypothetical protein GCM10011352_25450 [Marinobacterium zhoushanense]